MWKVLWWRKRKSSGYIRWRCEKQGGSQYKGEIGLYFLLQAILVEAIANTTIPICLKLLFPADE
jgi:hypothetical protein